MLYTRSCVVEGEDSVPPLLVTTELERERALLACECESASVCVNGSSLINGRVML